LLDIGCATGDFLELLSSTFKPLDLNGTDIAEEYLKAARSKVPRAKLKTDRIEVLNPDFINNFDVITIFGVIQQFENPEAVIKNLATYLKPGGSALIFSQFNHYGIDVYINYKYSGEKFPDDLQGGWVVHSLESLAKICETHSLEFNFTKFQVRSTIEPSVNPVRSWTTKPDESGIRQIVNGLGLIHNQGFALLTKRH